MRNIASGKASLSALGGGKPQLSPGFFLSPVAEMNEVGLVVFDYVGRGHLRSAAPNKIHLRVDRAKRQSRLKD